MGVVGEIGIFCSDKTLSSLQFERSTLMYSHNNAAVEASRVPSKFALNLPRRARL